MLISDGRFIDRDGRTLLLRGVNVSGNSKVPVQPHGATWNPAALRNHRNVSFVGHPFPLEEADEHFERLRTWGLTFLRWLVTWEAVEHAGPGIYDEAYLDYATELIAKAGEHGFKVLIDPHQDVWSRFSGGDGAPGWTFDAIGMDVTKFQETGAAIVHATHGDPFPRMIWPTNLGKLANLTMWTLFFGGDDFAPETQVDGTPVQTYLQQHYIDAVKQIASRVAHMDHVVGYDTLNEPSAGFIGATDLRERASMLAQGENPTHFQAMLLGAGYPQEVAVWETGLRGERKVDTRLVNSEGIRVWMDGQRPIWQENGVWGVNTAGEPELRRPQHFARVKGRRVKFHRDYLRPFANRFARAIRTVDRGAIIFVEGAPHRGPVPWRKEDAPNIAYAPHWYDYFTLFTKRYLGWFSFDVFRRRPVIGRRRVLRAFARQIKRLIRRGKETMRQAPTLIGEVGIPFDMQHKQAYDTGDFSLQIKAMDATMRALEANLANFTLWNYTPSNTNRRGDLWNDEDFSIFSRDQAGEEDSLHTGGRALPAVVRPYARKVAGTPLHMTFDLSRRRFEFEFHHDDTVTAPTEVYVPSYHYPEGGRITISDGEVEHDVAAQTLFYRHSLSRAVHHIIVEPK